MFRRKKFLHFFQNGESSDTRIEHADRKFLHGKRLWEMALKVKLITAFDYCFCPEKKGK
jgi:hypothetical protein